MLDSAPQRSDRPARCRDTLELDSYALVAANVVNGLLGLVFWAAAAHLYPTEAVGRAGAAINTAVLLSTMANLSFGPMLERFLPMAGGQARRRAVQAFAITGGCALVVGGVFAVTPSGAAVLGDPVSRWTFPLFVVILGASGLADSLLIAVHAGRYAAVKNVLHAVAKLVAIVGLAAVMTPTAGVLVWSWALPAAVAVAVVQVVVLGLGKGIGAQRDSTLPPWREVWSYFGASYGIVVLASAIPLALPLVVVSTRGATDNAYFVIVWSLVNAVVMALTIIGGPLIAGAAADESAIPQLLRRFLRVFAVVVPLGFLAMVVGGPIALALVGDEYLEHGLVLVLMAGPLVLLMAGPLLFTIVSRVHRTMAPAVVLHVLEAVLVIGSALLLTGPYGFVGLGVGYLGAELVLNLAVWPLLVRRLRADLQGVSGPAPSNP